VYGNSAALTVIMQQNPGYADRYMRQSAHEVRPGPVERKAPSQTPPLLWRLVGTKQLRRHAQYNMFWGPPAHQPYVARPLVGPIAATVGLTVLEQAGLEMWDQLIVNEILAAG
jgi:hypothetical protein